MPQRDTAGTAEVQRARTGEGTAGTAGAAGAVGQQAQQHTLLTVLPSNLLIVAECQEERA